MEYCSHDASVVKQFLEDNRVKSGWKRMILDNGELQSSLKSIINRLDLTGATAKKIWAPSANDILRAFAYSEPEDIKVVIIGTSPIIDYMANGLSFSSNAMEYDFDEYRAIFKVHKALKDAGILIKGVNYYCGHEEWAKRGILLLNAALTISQVTDSAGVIEWHCEIWKNFLQMLLYKWIEECNHHHLIYVMLWGYEGYLQNGRHVKNYAKVLWDGIPNVPSNFQVRHAHHPTFPKEDNMYEDEAKEHFIEVASVYSDIFHIRPVAKLNASPLNRHMTFHDL